LKLELTLFASFSYYSGVKKMGNLILIIAMAISKTPMSIVVGKVKLVLGQQ